MAAQRLAQEAEARAQEQTAAATRLRQCALLVAGVGLVAVLLAIATGVFGWRATNNAQRANAESTKAIANAGRADAESTKAFTNANRADAESTKAIANEGTAIAEWATAQAASTEAVQQRDLAERRQRPLDIGCGRQRRNHNDGTVLINGITADDHNQSNPSLFHASSDRVRNHLTHVAQPRGLRKIPLV